MARVEAIRADARQVDPPVARRDDPMVRAPVPEQIDHDETVRRRIAHVVTATAPIRHALHAMAIHVRVATVTLGPRAPAETSPIRLAPHGTAVRVPRVATATVHIHRDLGVTATVLIARRAPVATVHIRRGLLVKETAPIRLVPHVMGIHVHAATATVLVARRALEATGRTRLVLLEMETAHTLRVRFATVTRVHVVMGTGLVMTGLALTDRGAIVRMVIGHAGIGNPREVSVVRSVRR